MSTGYISLKVLEHYEEHNLGPRRRSPPVPARPMRSPSPVQMTLADTQAEIRRVVREGEEQQSFIDEQRAIRDEQARARTD